LDFGSDFTITSAQTCWYILSFMQILGALIGIDPSIHSICRGTGQIQFELFSIHISSPVDETVIGCIFNVVPYIVIVLTHTFLDVLEQKISLVCSELYNNHENKFTNILQSAVLLS